MKIFRLQVHVQLLDDSMIKLIFSFINPLGDNTQPRFNAKSFKPYWFSIVNTVPTTAAQKRQMTCV